MVEKVFAVIAESTRRDILQALASESKAVGQLVDELGVSQPTVSKHLRVLREAGVVTMRAQGQKRFYGINTEPLAQVSAWLEQLGAGVRGEAVAASPLSQVPDEPAAVPPAVPDEPELANAKSEPFVAAVLIPDVEAAPAVVSTGARMAAAHPVTTDGEGSVPAQIGRSVGRAANKAADILANLPSFRRKKD